MSIPKQFADTLRLPMVAAPMFLASSQDLVFECCTNGVLGTFPALNERTSEAFDKRLTDLKKRIKEWELSSGKRAAPFGVNLIVHRSNPRFDADLALCVKHEVPLIITSMGKASKVVEEVHSYGGLVFHDVVNIEFARKAIEGNVDGLIAVCAGAGGHGGDLSPFVLVRELREIFGGTILLGGGISTGNDVLAAQVMGADLVYVGTRFLGAEECAIGDSYRQMLIESSSKDIIYTDVVTGVPHNFLLPSLQQAGIDPRSKGQPAKELSVEKASGQNNTEKKAWKDIWSCGQGAGSIKDITKASKIIEDIEKEYLAALSRVVKRDGGV